MLYLFAGLSGSLTSLYWHPNLNSAGASGAIFGVLGGLFAFMVNPKTRIPASVAAVHRKSAVVFILYNLFNGFAHAGIDNAAHIGGLVAGFAMGWMLARPVEIEARQDPLPRLAPFDVSRLDGDAEADEDREAESERHRDRERDLGGD